MDKSATSKLYLHMGFSCDFKTGCRLTLSVAAMIILLPVSVYVNA